MGVCLTAAGIPLSGYHGAFCWFGHGRTHPLRAEELATWLNDTAPIVGEADISRRTKLGKHVSAADYWGRQGIVLFRNFWGAGNQGDHIDLWDGMQMPHGSLNYFARSQEIWFWDMTTPALW
jgi:Type VI secretion system (T6SS), amidase effector protein 4